MNPPTPDLCSSGQTQTVSGSSGQTSKQQPEAAVEGSGSVRAHAPGPWWVDVHTNIMAAGGLVAFPGVVAGFDQQANARLIAAAPELLEALRFYANSCDATETTPCGYEGNLCCKVARAAIAKALGMPEPQTAAADRQAQGCWSEWDQSVRDRLTEYNLSKLRN